MKNIRWKGLPEKTAGFLPLFIPSWWHEMSGEKKKWKEKKKIGCWTSVKVGEKCVQVVEGTGLDMS